MYFTLAPLVKNNILFIMDATTTAFRDLWIKEAKKYSQPRGISNICITHAMRLLYIMTELLCEMDESQNR